MQTLTENKAKALEISQAYWQRGDLHPSNCKWRTEGIEAYGFYEGGLGQWSQKDLNTVISRGQNPLTMNIIQSRIDSLSGVEIQSRFRSSVKNESNILKNDKLANAMTNWLYFIQQDQRIPYKGSLKFKDELICGMGWSNEYQENSRFFYEHVNPFNIIPDFDDLSPQFDNMKYVCRKRWMEPDVIIKTWPKVSKYIDFSNPTICSTVYSPEIMDRTASHTSTNNYSGYSQSRVLVCEVQYKVPRTSYCGLDYQGFYFETFDEEKAEDLANSPSDIEEKKSTQILRTLFLDNYLLEHSPLNPNIPGLEDFSYIPCVWKRRSKDGVPYGLLDGTKDIQRDSNVRLTKSLYLANSSKLIIQGNLPPGSEDQIAEQIKRPDAVIVLPQDSQFDLRSNDPAADTQLRMLDKYDMILQRITGIHDDMMGVETNASSRVAQRERQINSIRNNVFAFDSFADMKKREARFMLALIQGGDFENMISQVLNEEEKETIILNLVRTVNGKKHIFNDVRTLPISLGIEEVPDYKSSSDESREALESLLSNPSAPLIMQSPTLMRRFGIPDYEKVSQEIQQAAASQQGQQAENIPSQPSQGSTSQGGEEQSLVYPGL